MSSMFNLLVPAHSLNARARMTYMRTWKSHRLTHKFFILVGFFFKGPPKKKIYCQNKNADQKKERSWCRGAPWDLSYLVIWPVRPCSHTWLGLNPQIGRPLSMIVVPLVYFVLFMIFVRNFSQVARNLLGIYLGIFYPNVFKKSIWVFEYSNTHEYWIFE
jgi:hypothetical protein